MFETARRNKPCVPSTDDLNRHCRHSQMALMFTGGQSHESTWLSSHRVPSYHLSCRLPCLQTSGAGEHMLTGERCRAGQRCSPARLCMLLEALAVPRSFALLSVGKLQGSEEQSPLVCCGNRPDDGRLETGPTRRAVLSS